jgi:hypothetical protein
LRFVILQSSSFRPIDLTDTGGASRAVLPLSASGAEPRYRRWLYHLVALALAAAYFWVAMQYWVPAHGGVDQNGYLYGAKRLLETGSMAVKPVDPYAFVGRMWVTGAEPGVYYPKYPIGLPAIYAVALAIGGVKLVYLVNPIAMSLALLATYHIVSRWVGAFYGLLALLVVATSPVTMGLTNNPNSHATALCTVAWGMALLLSWWQSPKIGWAPWARVIAAGLLLGTAVTIRYTEGLLLLPIASVALFACYDAHAGRLRWKRNQQTGDPANADAPPDASATARWSWKREPLLQAIALFIAWAIPVGALLAVNMSYFGSPTGYDPTNESTGFLWAHFAENWDTMLRQFYMTGLMFLFPIAMIGLAVWFRHDVRPALVMTAWALPCVFIYTVYYWAPDSLAIGYSRFFLTVFPAMAAAAMVAMRLLDVSHAPPRRILEIAGLCAVAGAMIGAMLSRIDDGWNTLPSAGAGAILGLVLGPVLYLRPGATVVLAGCALAFNTSIANVESDQRGQTVVRDGGDVVAANVPAGSVVFSKDNLMHHLQLVGDWQFYPTDLFNEVAVRRLADLSEDLDKAQPFQPHRAKALYDLLKDDNTAQLVKRQNDLMDAALNAGQRVFFIATKSEVTSGRRRFAPEKIYDTKVIATWSEPSVVLSDNRPIRVSPPRARPRVADRVQMWQVVEITRKPVAPPPPPATAPVKKSPPATPPAKPAVAPATNPVLSPATKPAAVLSTKPAPAPATKPTTAPATKPAPSRAIRPTTAATTAPAATQPAR